MLMRARKTVFGLVAMLSCVIVPPAVAAQSTAQQARLFLQDKKCVFSDYVVQAQSTTAQPEPQAAPLVAALLGSVVDKGFDLLIGAMREAGKEKTLTLESYYATEVGPMPACLLVVGADFSSAPTLSVDESPAFLDGCGVPGTSYAKPFAAITGGRRIDWVVELEVHVAANGKAVSFKPTCVSFQKPFIKGGGDRDYLIFAGFLEPAAQSAASVALFNAQTSSVSLTIVGKLPLPSTLGFGSSAPKSPWAPLPQSAQEALATAGAPITPITAFVAVSETRSANRFLQLMAESLNDNKGALTKAVKGTFDPSIQHEMYVAEQDAIQTYSTKLATAVMASKGLWETCEPAFATPPAVLPLTQAIMTDVIAMQTAMVEVNKVAAAAGQVTPYLSVPLTVPTNDQELLTICTAIKPQ